MYFLNTFTMMLEQFHGETRPEYYSILSHRWTQNPGDEVSFQDLQDPDLTAAHQRRAWHKVSEACRTARLLGYRHIWIDTCCMDDTDLEERDAAVNGMFYLYHQAHVCIAYLEDLPGRQSVVVFGEHHSLSDAFRDSEWFTRGWTLQELLAPKHVLFYNQDFEFVGDKHEHCDVISQITGIDSDFINGQRKIASANIATRLSWASRRRTTVPEDIAYCLLGLLGVWMELRYREGPVKAFKRLQRAIIEKWPYEDYTLYAWLPDPRHCTNDNEPFDLLARSPRDFRRSGNFQRTYVSSTRTVSPVYDQNGRTIQICHLFPGAGRGKRGLAPDEACLTLPCQNKRTGRYLVIDFRRIGSRWYRVGCSRFQWTNEPPTSRGHLRTLYVEDPWRYDDISRRWHKEIDVTRSAIARREHREQKAEHENRKRNIVSGLAAIVLVSLIVH